MLRPQKFNFSMGMGNGDSMQKVLLFSINFFDSRVAVSICVYMHVCVID